MQSDRNISMKSIKTKKRTNKISIICENFGLKRKCQKRGKLFEEFGKLT